MINFRAIEREDLKTLRDWRNELKDNFRQYRFLSMENQEKWFNGLLTDDSQVMYAVVDEDNNLIGIAGWHNIDWLNRHADLSIYIGGEKGKGYGTATLKELHRIAFMELNLLTVRLEVFDFNPAKTLYERVGYKKVGVWRNAHFHAGVYHDSILMDLTREDWEKGGA